MGHSEDQLELVGHQVVLDTMGSMLYLGVLHEVVENGFVLVDVDVHDCRDGHAGREAYIMDAARDGISPNRRRVFVLREAVCSLSRVDDVIAE